MSILRRVLDKAVRLTALAGIGYLLVTIVITFVTRFQNSLWTTLYENFEYRLVPELLIGTKPNSSLR